MWIPDKHSTQKQRNSIVQAIWDNLPVLFKEAQKYIFPQTSFHRETFKLTFRRLVCQEFKDILGYNVKPYIKTNIKSKN